MKVDFHCLVATIAPRLLYISSGSADFWAAPKNELLTARLASPVYKNIYGIDGLIAPTVETNQPYHNGNIGYHIKEGGHSQNAYDWRMVLDFLTSKGW